jgi:Cu-Zn family superoxide dismutase
MKIEKIVFRIFFAALIAGCGTQKKADGNEEENTAEQAVEDEQELKKAVAILSSASGSKLEGKAYFMETENDMVGFYLEVSNIAPGLHAVHLHESGDCSAEDGTSAVSNRNTGDNDQGNANSEFHESYIQNIYVRKDSSGILDMTFDTWTIGGPDSSNVIGKVVIVHEVADDNESQPSAAAGTRIGCGVVKLSD